MLCITIQLFPLILITFCKLVHLTRATPTSLIKDALAVFDAGVRGTFCLCTGVDASNDAWQQAQLSLRKGGLGLRSLSLHSPAAFIASVCSAGYGSHSTSQAIDMFNCLVASSDVISVENLLSSSSVHQKALSEKLDEHQFNLLLNCSSGLAYFQFRPPLLLLGFLSFLLRVLGYT